MPLPDDGKVGIADRAMEGHVILGIRQCRKAFPLGGGQIQAAGRPHLGEVDLDVASRLLMGRRTYAPD